MPNNMVNIIKEMPMLKGHLLTRSTGTSRLIHCFDWSGSTLARGFSKRGSTLTGSKLKEDSETFVVSGAVSVTDILNSMQGSLDASIIP